MDNSQAYDPMNEPQRYFFDTIIRKAHERVITSADFAEFVGCHNWLLMDCGDGDMIVEFILRRVFDDGKVEILVAIGQNYEITRNVENGVAWHIDADELALRMDAS